MTGAPQMKPQITTLLGTIELPSLEDALTELEMAGLEAEETRRGTWRIVDSEGNLVGRMKMKAA